MRSVFFFRAKFGIIKVRSNRLPVSPSCAIRKVREKETGMKARRCPLCRKETSWDDNPWMPFCSERCQTIDLGRWASEDYRVPLAETPDGLTADFDRDYDADQQYIN